MGTGTMHISHLMTHAIWNERPQPSSHKQRMENKHWASICLSSLPTPIIQTPGLRSQTALLGLLRECSNEESKPQWLQEWDTTGSNISLWLQRYSHIQEGDLFFTSTTLVNDSFIYMAQYSLHGHYWHVIPTTFLWGECCYHFPDKDTQTQPGA